MFFRMKLFILVLILMAKPALAEDLPDFGKLFKSYTSWQEVDSVALAKDARQLDIIGNKGASVLLKSTLKEEDLISQGFFSDSHISFEFMLAKDARAQIYLQGRYAINLAGVANQQILTLQNAGGLDARIEDSLHIGGVAPLVNAAKPAGEWQRVDIKFRAPRFDDARNKIEDALFIEISLNDKVVQQNTLATGVTQSSRYGWEDQFGPLIIAKVDGAVALRAFDIRHADFGAVKVPASSGQKTNIEELTDLVAEGKETFHSLGCASCHAIKENDPSVKSGPNLFSLFKRVPRDREIVEGEDNRRFTIKANRNYLLKSIREPASQRAVAEMGNSIGEAYLPIMPPYSEQSISEKQVDAISAYLTTLNPPQDQGPAILLVTKEGPTQYDPLNDDLQLLVDDQTRIQRGPMEGVSGRSIHVGQTNGINYTFDPRLLAIVKIWQGGFLDVSGELKNRGGRGLKPGYESRVLEMGQAKFLMAPLDDKGQQIDFSFKEAVFNDTETIAESLYSKQDHLQRLKAIDAQFLGYEQDSSSAQSLPLFRYRIGKNKLSIETHIAVNGATTIRIRGQFVTSQTFTINTEVLHDVQVSVGDVKANSTEAKTIWRIPAKANGDIVLNARLKLASSSWRPKSSDFVYQKQKLQIIPAQAELAEGYRVESYLPPRDNYGREQLFEALGLAVAEDGTIVVATRTAGIWRIVKGEWQLFAEGVFDSLGVLIEDKKGLQLVVGQKAELTRITDTNNDGRADKFETLFDVHSYHGNYHAYMHGPARGSDGAYYIALNLSHSDEAVYKAGGMYMGTSGGFSGWAIRVTPEGKYELWANGLRSPAGIATAPDGRLWYSDNQGEFVATSKIFVLKKDAFYGHPAGLVDLPGMTPDSPQIAWKKVRDKRQKAVVLLPQNRVANSPGHPVWDTTGGRFGPFSGHMFIGDQTQSNLLRVVTETVDEVEQGVVVPFAAGLESGVMRPVFLADGSLLLGQTGRGWQAKGGHVASLQRIVRDNQALPTAIFSVSARADGFEIKFTKPVLAVPGVASSAQLLKLSSWVYRDAPDYGSEVMDEREEPIKNLTWSDDKTSLFVHLTSTKQANVHPQQTARVYYFSVDAKGLYGEEAPPSLEAYYTLYRFPAD